MIAKAGRPVARLVALEDRSERTPGFWKERIAVAEDWDSPEINKEIEDLFHRDESGE